MPRRPRPTGRRTRLPEIPRIDSITRARSTFPFHRPSPRSVSRFHRPNNVQRTSCKTRSSVHRTRKCEYKNGRNTRKSYTRAFVWESSTTSHRFFTPNTSVSCTASVYGPPGHKTGKVKMETFAVHDILVRHIERVA